MGEFVSISWPSHAEQICEGMWKCLQENYKTNFVISVSTSDGVQRLVKAHQLILSIFCSAVRNTDEAILELGQQSDVDEEALKFLLEFIYRGKTKIAVNKMCNLKQAAKTLGFQTLVESITNCEKHRQRCNSKKSENVTKTSLYQTSNSLTNSEVSNTESELEPSTQENPIARPRTNNLWNLSQPKKELGVATSYLKHKLKVKNKLERMRKCRAAVPVTKNPDSEGSFFNHDTQTCNLCDKRFISKQYFANHIRSHLKPETMRQCPHCISKFQTNRNLESHVASVHLKDMEGNVLEKKYKCDECNYTAVFQHFITFHKKKKHGARPHKCDLCSYSGQSKADLIGHKQGKHGNARPFICEACGYRAKTKKAMLCHADVHREKVTCDECGALYSIRALKQHKQRVHNQGIKFKCHLCAYEATCTRYLATHLKNVHKFRRDQYSQSSSQTMPVPG